MCGLVSHLDMHRIAIRIGIDSDGRDAHLPGRLDDTAGNLASVGDQDFLEHQAASPSASFRACGCGQARFRAQPLEQS
jgi:hypothetical protein